MSMIRMITSIFLMTVWFSTPTAEMLQPAMYTAIKNDVGQCTNQCRVIKGYYDIDTCDAQYCQMEETQKKYVTVDIEKTWYEAYKHCQSKGWRLATAQNAKENDELRQIVKSAHPDKTLQFFIGGAQLGHTRTWWWLPSRQKVNFTDWAKDQPNNVDKDEYCLSLYGEYDLHWNDYWCERKLRFVCEYLITVQCCDQFVC